MKKIDANFLKPSQQQLNSLLKYYQTGQYIDAEKLSLSITQEFPKHQFGWKILGAVLLKLGKKNESLHICQKSLQLAPNDSEAHNNLGVILHQLDRLSEAEASFRQAISLKLDYAEAHNKLGVILQQLDRISEAEASFKQAIILKPDLAVAHYNLGNSLKEQGKLKEAEASFRQAITLKPDYAEAYNKLGVILQQLDRLSEAEASFRQAISLKPNYTEAHINLGNTLQEQGKLKEAESSFRQAVTLKPDLAVAQYNLGKIYKKIGKNSKAVECFEKTLELSSEDLLGATLQLATLGKRKIPDKTPENFMQGFYKKKFKYWSNLEKKTHKYQGHLLIENAFKTTHNNIEKIDILDVGCGTGSLAKILRPYARTLVGVDLSPDMLLKAEEICLYDSLYKKDLSQYLSEVSNHYDTIIAAAVLIHFYDLESIFFLIKDSLKTNGKFVFSIFEETQKNRNLNSFLMYAHSDYYITSLADRLNLKIIYRQKDTHEYHKGISVPAIIYVLEKN